MDWILWSIATELSGSACGSRAPHYCPAQCRDQRWCSQLEGSSLSWVNRRQMALETGSALASLSRRLGEQRSQGPGRSGRRGFAFEEAPGRVNASSYHHPRCVPSPAKSVASVPWGAAAPCPQSSAPRQKRCLAIASQRSRCAGALRCL